MSRTELVKARHDLAAVAAVLDSLVANQSLHNEDPQMRDFLISETATRIHSVIKTLDAVGNKAGNSFAPQSQAKDSQ